MQKQLLLFFVGILLTLTGCEKESNPIQAIIFNTRKITAGLGEPVKLTITTYPENADPSFELEWKVDKTLADFDEATRTVTRKANGPVTVTVSVKGKPYISSSVTIDPVIATKIAFKEKVIDAEVGKLVKVELEVTPSGADTNFTWSLNKNIATFDKVAKTVTLNEANLVELTASLKDNPEISGTCAIKVPNFIYIANQRFKSSILKQVDTNNDGEIDKVEADATKQLYIEMLYTDDHDNISDDLKYFKNIKGLIAFNLTIPKADFSLFPSLKNLRLYSSKIESLDLSKNTELENLYLEANFELSSLNISNCSKLSSLVCDHNNLSSVQVAHLNSLSLLSINEQRVSSLDISNNLLLKKLSIASSNISSIDISKNVNLESLDCSDTPIRTLDISKNLHLSTLTFYKIKYSGISISQNENLSNLSVNGSDLQTIDLSGLPNLVLLYCAESKLTKLDLSKNTKLCELNCSRNNLTNLDLSNNSKLFRLTCYTNNLSSVDLSSHHYSSIDFTNNPNLKKIYVWKWFEPNDNFYKKDATAEWVLHP